MSNLLKPTRPGLMVSRRALITAAMAFALPANAGGLHGHGSAAGGGSQTTLWDTVTGASANATITNGDKTLNGVSTVTTRRATTALTADTYWEIEVTAQTTGWFFLGATRQCIDDYLSNSGPASGAGFVQNGRIYPDGSSSESYTFTVGDVLGFYWKNATSKLFMTKDNVNFFGLVGTTDDPSVPTGGLDLSATTAGGSIYPGASVETGDSILLRAGTNIIRTPLAGFTVLP